MARDLANHSKRGGSQRTAALTVALVLSLGAAIVQAAEADLVDPAARRIPMANA